MKRLLKTIILFILLITVLNGCSLQKGISSGSKTYNRGDNIKVCPSFNNVSENKESIYFLLKSLNIDKPVSGSMWSSSDTNIKECYDLSKMKWDKTFSSLMADYDLDFYEVIKSGEYSLEVSLAILEDNGDYIFIKAEPIVVIIK